MEMNQRLKFARERARYETATDAARAFGWPVSTYLGHENGDRNFSRKAAARYSKAFRVSSAWLLTGEGEPSRTNVFPVWGYVGLGEGVELIGEQAGPLDEIELPYGFTSQNCGALIAKGNSQYPRVKDGEVVVYERNGNAPDDLIGTEVIVQVKEGPVLLKTLRRSAMPGRYNLESHNAPTIEDVQVEWLGEILAIVPRGKWKLVR